MRDARARGDSRKPIRNPAVSFRLRLLGVAGLLGVAAAGLVGVAVHWQLVKSDFLMQKGDRRFARVAPIVAHRGNITDRNGEPLAVSTPVDSVTLRPALFAGNEERIPQLAKLLKVDRQDLLQRVTSARGNDFMYIARGLPPDDGRKVRDLAIPGIGLQREYRRYYPAAEVAGHLLGFTNVDDQGQEGLEREYNGPLAGRDGAKRVIQDNAGRRVEDVESIREVIPGRDLVTSIDLRIQYLAYRALKAAVIENHARGGSVVMIDVSTGEVLAMVNQPYFNPNDRAQRDPGAYRNRAVTDLFEPGSTMKPFFVAAALASGRYNAGSVIDTGNGFLMVGNTQVEDEHPIGLASLSTILAKSSNVGMAKLALTLDPQQMWDTLNKLGFGHTTTSSLPGESAGVLSNYKYWRPVGIVTMSHGYGLSVTPLQLAHAYATIGALGQNRPVSLIRVDEAVSGEQVLDPQVCRSLIKLLESVVSEDGTAPLAHIPGYQVSGKTGTAWKASNGSYARDRFVATFSGLAPASNPRLATVVVLDEPSNGLHQGGQVSAPVFATIVGGALRLLGVPPDDAIRDEKTSRGAQVAQR